MKLHNMPESTPPEVSKRVNKLRKTTHWVQLISAFLILTALGLFLLITNHQGTQITEQKAVIQFKDTLLQQHALDSTAVDRKRDSLHEKISTFFRLVNAHRYDSLQQIYADTLIHYFKAGTNIPKSAALKWEKHNWSDEYRHSRFDISRPPVIIGDTAWVTGLFREEENVTKSLVVQLQFNRAEQITFVRALHDK